MLEYPPIDHSTGQSFREFVAHVFDKLDGNNLRAQWTKKKGWHLFGTRTALFDHTDKIYGPMIPIFMEKHSEILTKMARDQRWQQLKVFGEFWGAKTFVGIHQPDDPKFYTIFDLAPDKEGMLGPKEYLKLVDKYGLDSARYLGHFNWTHGFVKEVWEGKIDCAFEGVVGKAGRGSEIIRAKCKTQAWIEKVRSNYTPEEAEKIINS